MALTKLPKAGLATEPVSTSQIEDGTIQNQEFEDGTLTSVELIRLYTCSTQNFQIQQLHLTEIQYHWVISGTFVDGELVGGSCNI